MDSNISKITNPGHIDINALTAWMSEIRSSVSSITSLNERHANNERRLAESEERTATALEIIQREISQVRERMDVVVESMREEVTSVRIEMHTIGDRQRSETTEHIEKATHPIWERIDKNAKDAKDTRTELDSWINRARGAWFVASICAIIFQGCIVVALLWAVGEIKTLHDWRIVQEAQQTDRKPKS